MNNNNHISLLQQQISRSLAEVNSMVLQLGASSRQLFSQLKPEQRSSLQKAMNAILEDYFRVRKWPPREHSTGLSEHALFNTQVYKDNDGKDNIYPKDSQPILALFGIGPYHKKRHRPNYKPYYGKVDDTSNTKNRSKGIVHYVLTSSQAGLNHMGVLRLTMGLTGRASARSLEALGSMSFQKNIYGNTQPEMNFP